jgi:hypothetical protein
MKYLGRLASLLAFIAVLGQAASAQQVMVSPGTIVFDERTRGAELLVANTGDRISTYRLEPAYFMMGEDGILTEVTGPQPADSAVDMLRYSPRQFQLAPGASQIVRLAVRKPGSLSAGEYRVHLRVTNLGELSERPALPRSDGSFAEIKFRVTRAIRIIVRHGVAPGTVGVQNLTARRGANDRVQVTFELQRSGAASARGRYVLFSRDRRTGRTAEKFVQQGVIIYKDLPGRRISHALPAAKLNGNPELCVAYHDTGASARRKKLDVSCVSVRPS